MVVIRRAPLSRVAHRPEVLGIPWAKVLAPRGAPAHDDLVRRVFTAEEPNQLWLTDIERHEALSNLAVVKGHRHRLVAAG